MSPGPYAAIRFTLGRPSSCKILLQFKHLSKFLTNFSGRTGLETLLKVSLAVRMEMGQLDRHHVKSHITFKITSWNIGTMRDRLSETVETITKRNIDLYCMQEVRWRGASARLITGKDSNINSSG